MTERWRYLDLDRQGPYENGATMPVLVRSVAEHGEPIAQTSVWGQTHLNVGWFDDVDAALADEVAAAGVRPVVAPTIMADRAIAAALARTTIEAVA